MDKSCICQFRIIFVKLKIRKWNQLYIAKKKEEKRTKKPKLFCLTKSLLNFGISEVIQFTNEKSIYHLTISVTATPKCFHTVEDKFPRKHYQNWQMKEDPQQHLEGPMLQEHNETSVIWLRNVMDVTYLSTNNRVMYNWC